MYHAKAEPEGFHIAVDGPLSLFKLTERYGTSIAKLLPDIVEAEGWRINANVVKEGNSGRRILQLDLNCNEAGALMKNGHSRPSADAGHYRRDGSRVGQYHPSHRPAWLDLHSPTGTLAGALCQRAPVRPAGPFPGR